MVICLPYDLDDIYCFFCSRYKDITIEEFFNLKASEFNRKIKSIPKSEPLYEILRSRVINLAEIKDKEERKYWRKLKKINRIPDEYISIQELDNRLIDSLKHSISKEIKK